MRVIRTIGAAAMVFTVYGGANFYIALRLFQWLNLFVPDINIMIYIGAYIFTLYRYFYQKHDKNIYIFAAGIKNKTNILMGIISRNEIEPAKIAIEYVKQSDVKLQNITFKEITLSYAHKLLNTSEGHDLIGDHGDILGLFDLKNVSGHYHRSIDYKESILTNSIHKKTSPFCPIPCGMFFSQGSLIDHEGA